MADQLKQQMDDRFDEVVKQTVLNIKERIESGIGLTDEPNFIRLLEDVAIKSEIKNCLCDFVAPQGDSNNCTKEIEKIASRSKLYNRDTFWAIKDLVNNLYKHYDRSYNKYLALEFGMKYFMYQGGLIRDSRDFCACHNNKVWSVDEAQEWKTWTPSKGKYPEGYKIQQKDINAVPSYLSYLGYDPLVDAGGYNCRHIIGFISDELAVKYRPDLIKNEEQPINIKIELNKSLSKSDLIIIEKKRNELLDKVNIKNYDSVNYLLNKYVNELTGSNEPITFQGVEITLVQALDLITPKILETISLINDKSNGIINLK